MTDDKKSVIDIGTEIHLAIEKSLLETGEAFITKDGEVIDPETVSVEKDDSGKTVFRVGKEIDKEVFAVIANKGSPLIGDLLEPRPYQRAAMDALLDDGLPELPSLMRRREPTFLPLSSVTATPTGRAKQPFHPLIHSFPIAKPANPGLVSRVKTTPIVTTIDLLKENPDGRIAKLSVDNRMTEQFDKVGKLLARMTDRIVFHSLFGGVPPPGFEREKRIASLILSGDRRKRKRGERLFEHWRRSRPGYGLQRNAK